MKNDNKNLPAIQSYEPDNVLKNGYFAAGKEIFTEINRNRWLILQLFKRDFFAMYKQSFMGLLWAVIIPLVSVGTFVILNRAGIFSTGTVQTPYAIYAVLGIAIWQLFAAGLVAGSNSLVKAGAMIVKINFSKKSLVLAALGQAPVACLIQLLLLFILFFIYSFKPTLYILLLPLLCLPILLLTAGLGFVFAILNGIMRDIGNAISILMTFLMFLTPILYAKPQSGLLAKISHYNPLYYLVAFPRDLVLTGTTAELTGYLIATILALGVFMICIFTFHLAETRVTERI